MTTLYHDKPASRGVENVLRRAAQLRDMTWTPVEHLPSAVALGKKEYTFGYFKPWLPQKGAPYSSCRSTEKYIGWNISLETYYSALRNPNSVIYTRDLKEQPGNKAHCWYGLVCSMYASYALQLPYRAVCKEFADVPGMDPMDSSVLENLQLCDVLLSKGHVALVTDILRDAEGTVHSIEVSECTLPLTVSNWFTPEEFRGYWLEKEYNMYRYAYLDAVTYEPSPWVRVAGDPETARPEITTALMLDYGNKANYRIGDEPVEISVFEEGWEAVEVTDPNGDKQRYAIGEEKKLVLNPAVPGFYSARLVKNGAESACVEWCMVSISVAFEQEKYAVGDTVRCRFENAAEDAVFHMVVNDDRYYVLTGVNLSEEEMNSGWVTVPAVEKAGKYIMILLAKNAYGVYSSPYMELTVE